MSWAGNVACMGKRRNLCRLLVEKPKEKQQIGRQRNRWEDYIKMDHKSDGRVWT